MPESPAATRPSELLVRGGTLVDQTGSRQADVLILHGEVTEVAPELEPRAGAVVLERLFERWGLGTLILEAYASRDLPVLEGAVVASGAVFVLVQTLAVVVHAGVDVRARQ